MVSTQDLSWLAGFFDGEGYITTRARNQLQLGIDNTDKALLKKAQSILDHLEIDSILSPRSPRGLGKKPIFRLSVQSFTGIERFFNKVPVASTSKIDRWTQLKGIRYSHSAEHTKARRGRLARVHQSLL